MYSVRSGSSFTCCRPSVGIPLQGRLLNRRRPPPVPTLYLRLLVLDFEHTLSSRSPLLILDSRFKQFLPLPGWDLSCIGVQGTALGRFLGFLRSGTVGRSGRGPRWSFCHCSSNPAKTLVFTSSGRSVRCSIRHLCLAMSFRLLFLFLRLFECPARLAALASSR